MKVFARILAIINTAVAVVTALLLGFWCLQEKTPDRIRDWLQNYPHSAEQSILLAAGILFGLNVLFVLGWIFFRPRPYLKIKTEPGEASISVGAIEDSLARAAMQMPEIYHARVQLYPPRHAGHAVVVRVVFSMWEDTSVKFVSQRLNAALERRFQQLLGTDLTPSFRLVLTRIVSRDSKKDKKDKKGTPQDSYRESFRGPEYPVM